MANNDQRQPTHSGTGNFLSGLVFGAVAGMAGYYFFGTEDGKKARRKLGEEWESAKGYLIEQGVLDVEHSDKNLPHMIQHTIQRVIDPARRKPIPKSNITPPRKKTKKFKGV